MILWLQVKFVNKWYVYRPRSDPAAGRWLDLKGAVYITDLQAELY
jgi:hypothetical protein